MTSRCYFVLLLLCNCCTCFAYPSDSFVKKIYKEPKKDIDGLNKMAATLLTTCFPELKQIVIYDNSRNSSTFETLSGLNPPRALSLVSQLETKLVIDDQLNDIGIPGIILVVNPFKDWHFEFEIIIKTWQYNLNCIIIIIPTPNDKCKYVEEILMFITEFFISTVYYLCFETDNIPVIYTHDPYGDSKPTFWKKKIQKSVNTNDWTLYYRLYHEDIYRGFSFNRTDMSDSYITLGVEKHFFTRYGRFKENNTYDEKDEQYLAEFVKGNILAMKKILNIRFKYYVGNRVEYYKNKTHGNNRVGVVYSQLHKRRNSFWHISFPYTYDQYAILSHHRGFSTPLEKIAKFYGPCTLVSLVIICVMAFFVIWCKTNRNVSTATFNILSLLTNGRIDSPIDTLSLKMFFSMIFLYFLVIHATFSGHLAEFLTKVELRKNVDTIEDLTDSRIVTIYQFAFKYDDFDNREILNSKSIFIQHLKNCTQLAKLHRDSVCLGWVSYLQYFTVVEDDLNELYISNHKYYTQFTNLLYHNRFPFKGQFDWALMALTETKIFNREITVKWEKGNLDALKNSIRLQVDFRPIALADLKFAFILWCVGISLGLLCFLVEILMRRICNMKEKLINTKILNNRGKIVQKQGRFKITVRENRIRKQLPR